MRCLVTFCLCLCFGSAAFAQPVARDGRSFRTISLSAGGQLNLNDNTRLHEYWSSGRGGWLSVTSPFLAGEATLYLAAHRYGSIDPQAPPFTGLMTSVGWGLPVEVTSRLEVSAGMRTGIYIMQFDEPSEQAWKSASESEMVVAPYGEVEYQVAEGWQVCVTVQHLRVFTSERLALTYGGLGVRHTFDTPEWLRTFLR